MSLRAMHESRQNSLESKQDKTEPVILPENLIERLAEAQKALEWEQERRIQAEQKANSETEKNKTLQRLLIELSETSDSEMPKKLNEQLNESEKKLLNEQEQNRQLTEQLQNAAVTADNDRTTHEKEKSQLEAKISYLKRQLRYSHFDKKQYLKGLESREQAIKQGEETLKSDRAEFNTRVQSKAQEIEQDTIVDYEARKAECEAEKARLIEQQRAVETERQEWLYSEKEKIATEIERQVTAHKAELDEQSAQERAEQERQHDEREKALEKHWISRNGELIAKFASISGITVIGGLISAVTAVFSVIIAFAHGLLPFIIEDGKEIGSWISSDWHSIFGQAFVFPQSLLPILQLALPLIFLIIVGIWTALDFDERKWVVFADKVSCIFIGTSIGISSVFGKQLSAIGLNTVMFPIAVYLLYVLFRWLKEIDAIQLITSPIDWWKGLDSNKKIGNSIIAIVIIGGIYAIWNGFKG